VDRLRHYHDHKFRRWVFVAYCHGQEETSYLNEVERYRSGVSIGQAFVSVSAALTDST
jgi:hypothetical protein